MGHAGASGHRQAWGAGAEYLEKTGYEEIASRTSALNARCREGIGNIKGLQLRGMEYNPPKGQESGCLLFTCGGREQPLAQRLYDRAILPCGQASIAHPLAHDRIGTGKTGGLRVSFSLFTCPEHIDRFLEILNQCVREYGCWDKFAERGLSTGTAIGTGPTGQL